MCHLGAPFPLVLKVHLSAWFRKTMCVGWGKSEEVGEKMQRVADSRRSLYEL